ncbi:hypothetical protein SK128_008342 [Halocaridina rubra]|uniref:Uncharacterized protein n=1 Tax=Halocaridina rubra TaxID=373956 RepID=A0AAN9A9K4_HALRR
MEEEKKKGGRGKEEKKEEKKKRKRGVSETRKKEDKKEEGGWKRRGKRMEEKGRLMRNPCPKCEVQARRSLGLAIWRISYLKRNGTLGLVRRSVTARLSRDFTFNLLQRDKERKTNVVNTRDFTERR